MPLDKAGLKSDIKALLNEAKTKEDQQAAIDDYATKLADAIDKFVKSGEVNTSGSPTTHTGKVT